MRRELELTRRRGQYRLPILRVPSIPPGEMVGRVEPRAALPQLLPKSVNRVGTDRTVSGCHQVFETETQQLAIVVPGETGLGRTANLVSELDQHVTQGSSVVERFHDGLPKRQHRVAQRRHQRRGDPPLQESVVGKDVIGVGRRFLDKGIKADDERHSRQSLLPSLPVR